jgi:hypothetical protein
MVLNRTTLENDYYASQHTEAAELEKIIDQNLKSEWIPGGYITIYLKSLPSSVTQKILIEKYLPCGFALKFDYTTQYNQCEYYIRVTAAD